MRYFLFISCPRRQETNQRNAAQEGEGLDFKKATSRIFEILNILSLLRITLTCRQSRREGGDSLQNKRLIFTCNTIAVILRLKSSRFYKLIWLHHQIICEGVFWLHLFCKKGGTRLPDKSKFESKKSAGSADFCLFLELYIIYFCLSRHLLGFLKKFCDRSAEHLCYLLSVFIGLEKRGFFDV